MLLGSPTALYTIVSKLPWLPLLVKCAPGFYLRARCPDPRTANTLRSFYLIENWSKAASVRLLSPVAVFTTMPTWRLRATASTMYSCIPAGYCHPSARCAHTLTPFSWNSRQTLCLCCSSTPLSTLLCACFRTVPLHFHVPLALRFRFCHPAPHTALSLANVFYIEGWSKDASLLLLSLTAFSHSVHTVRHSASMSTFYKHVPAASPRSGSTRTTHGAFFSLYIHG